MRGVKTLATELASHDPCPFGCGSSDGYSETEKLGGLLGRCFSCGKSKFYEYNFSAKKKEVTYTQCTYPDNYSKALPDYMKDYLYEFLTDEDIQKYDIASAGCRIFLPVRDKLNRLKFYQTRRIHPDDVCPKYMSPKGVKRSIFFSDHESVKTRVICEDMMSAIKVAHILPSCSILGTSLQGEEELLLAQSAEKYIIWLDGDSAGQTGRDKLYLKLKSYGEVTYIDSPRDPKFYTDEEIRQWIDKQKQFA